MSEDALEGATPEMLADELQDRGIPVELVLDAVGVLLERSPDAAAIVSGWMLRMMGGSMPTQDFGLTKAIGG